MTVHLIISGRVQGVFFRASARDIAKGLGITGWVKNTFDGNVEIMASGEKPLLDRYIEWCRRGPKKADVLHVLVTEKEETAFEGFSILRD